MVDTKKSELIKNLQAYLKCKRVQERALNFSCTDLIIQNSEIVVERIHMLISEWANNDEGVLKKSIADAERQCGQFATDIELDFYTERTEKENIQQRSGFMMESAAITLGTAIMALYTIDILKPNFKLNLAALAVTVTVTITGGIHIARNHFQQQILEEMKTLSDDERTGNLISKIFERPIKNWIKHYKIKMRNEIASQEDVVQKLSTEVHLETGFQSKLESLLYDLNKSLKHLEKIGVEYNSDDSVSCDCLSIDSSTLLAT
ncbi:hypothetical protein ACJMK2_037708 [Sinanodonta woodiana]|uniref:SMODS and SLOG-associating 2TM effector domain-containing protein n=1 Tax=Sinanodonta woodiana TaxID=1069815 RepID=A0ABD3WN51_SINWO